MSIHLTRYLGRLGKNLPELNEKEWNDIFNFIEFFLTTENKIVDFNWSKVIEVLTLLNKVK